MTDGKSHESNFKDNGDMHEKDNEETRVKDSGEARDDKRAIKRAKRKERLKTFFWKALFATKRAVYPEDVTCDCCGEELTAKTRYRLCGECTSKLPIIPEHICLVCGTPILDEADYCNRCQQNEYKFLRNRAPLVYDGIAKDMVYKLKFGGKKYIASTLGAMMTDEFLKRNMQADIAVYIPMTYDEEKKRGFNQSELLAREVGERLNMPVLPALIKTRDTAAQKQLTRKEREENLKGVFACVFDEVKGRKMLLIDDVFTTGATANACASALIKGGAREVSVLTAAVTKLKIPVESNDGTAEI
ncbi:MAG: ComF family protein [Clostridia bacterium]|nr:ComF family protein [Clostridia bacterium]